MVSHDTAPSEPSTDASDQKVSWAQPGNSSPVMAAKLPDADETDRWDRSEKYFNLSLIYFVLDCEFMLIYIFIFKMQNADGTMQPGIN